MTSLLRLILVLHAFVLVPIDYAKAQSQVGSSKACILIQQTKPSVVKSDDSGITTEPILITVKAVGRPEDLRGGQIIYLEDLIEKRSIPVGDLHAGVQTLTVPSGFQMNSSSELFDLEIIGSKLTNAYIGGMVLNSPNYVPPPEASLAVANSSADAASDEMEESDQPIETIEPGVDRQEVYSIRQFGAGDIGITSTDGIIRETRGDERQNPPQTLTLQGVNFKDGILVKFSTKKGGQSVEATSPLTHTKVLATLQKPSGYTPDNPSVLMSSVVTVPPAITHSVESAFAIRAANAESTDDCK
ncbi:MAG: hypothetical protein ABSB66_01750 [Candidatus Acidiferrales bacterium]|jgi:hypothetical protein